MLKYIIRLSVSMVLLVLLSGSVHASLQEASTRGPVCGNGIVESGEGCDAGGSNSSCPAVCSVSCTVNSCVSGGGGGGGGIVYLPPVTGIIFIGKAYPLSKVTILKDGQVATSTIAGPDASFYISLAGLSSGNYIFSIFGEDNGGKRSTLFTFPVYITQGVTTQIGGIFIAPTIDVDRSAVKRGDNITIFGQSAPKSEITIAVNSETEIFIKTQSDKNGAYLYNFDTSSLENGNHSTKSKASLGGEVSPFGRAVSFAVGDKTVGVQGKCGMADLNCDTKVNLIDFSILLYWWKKPSAIADLNASGMVDLADFSIMLYHWSG